MLEDLREGSIADGREALESRAGEQIALKEADAFAGQPLILLGSFNAFGDEIDAEVVTNLDDGTNDDLSGTCFFNVADELLVELELVGLEVGEKVEAGVTGTEVVDGEFEAYAAVVIGDPGEASAVFDDFAFSDFEDDAVERKVGTLGGLDGVADGLLRRRRAVGDHVEVELVGKSKLLGESDGEAAAVLVEARQVFCGNLLEDAGGGLISRAANERFVGDDVFRFDVHDGLEGKGDGGEEG